MNQPKLEDTVDQGAQDVHEVDHFHPEDIQDRRDDLIPEADLVLDHRFLNIDKRKQYFF